jgi:hypothetical protein
VRGEQYGFDFQAPFLATGYEKTALVAKAQIEFARTLGQSFEERRRFHVGGHAIKEVVLGPVDAHHLTLTL